MAHTTTKNNQDGYSDKNISDWEIISLQSTGNRYFIILSGNTLNVHEAIISRLKSQRPDLKEVFSVDECDLILLFCPVVSRAGTDIDAAIQVLDKYSDTKPTVFMVLHQTFDPDCVLPKTGSAENRTNTIIIHLRVYEDQGLLQGPKNDEAFDDAINHLSILHQEGPNLVSSSQYRDTNTFSFQQDNKETPEQELRLLLIGRTGMAAARNFILGIEEENQANTSTATAPFTQQSTPVKVAGKMLTIVVTPDWFSSEFSNLRQDVGKYVRLSAPGPHAFLLVIPVMQLETEEIEETERIEECFGEECWENTMIVFTVYDTSEKRNIELFMQKKKELFKKIGKRFYCLDMQKREDTAQIPGLLEKIEQMVQESGMKFYSSEVYQETESIINRICEHAYEKQAKAEGEVKGKEMEANYQKFLLPELWKTILTLQYRIYRTSSDKEPGNKNNKQ